jgi:hypothetical protein
VSKNGEQKSDCWDEVLDPFYFGQELNNSPEKKKHNGCQHVTVYFRKFPNSDRLRIAKPHKVEFRCNFRIEASDRSKFWTTIQKAADGGDLWTTEGAPILAKTENIYLLDT